MIFRMFTYILLLPRQWTTTKWSSCIHCCSTLFNIHIISENSFFSISFGYLYRNFVRIHCYAEKLWLLTNTSTASFSLLFHSKKPDTQGFSGHSVFQSHLTASGVLCYHRTQSARFGLTFLTRKSAKTEPFFACLGMSQALYYWSTISPTAGYNKQSFLLCCS